MKHHGGKLHGSQGLYAFSDHVDQRDMPGIAKLQGLDDPVLAGTGIPGSFFRVPFINDSISVFPMDNVLEKKTEGTPEVGISIVTAAFVF